MKRSKLILTTFLLALWSYTAFAQQSTYIKQPGYWTFGINGGAAWQQSDVPALLEGYGGGLTLAKNLYYQPQAPFSFDLRGRLLYTRTYGLDHARSSGIRNNDALNGTLGPDYRTETGGPGFVFQNNKTDLFELGLEGVLNFNQLRERSNILLALYGGIGLDWYNTKIDQLDANGSLYTDAYQNIDVNRSVSSIKKNLKENILDRDYETNAHGFESGNGRAKFMPSLGIELGYQLTPRFSAGIGHRITFSGTDILDGHQWKDNDELTSENDLHHYTSLHLRWEIPLKEKELPAPLITIIEPRTNPYTTNNPNELVKARIQHVNSTMDVTCELNGRPINFDFRREQFSAQPFLELGRNELVITATNTVGSDRKMIVFIFSERVIEEPPAISRPDITITNPPQENYRTQQENFVLRANITNIKDRRNIRFSFNGRSSVDFDYDYSRQRFSANVRLQEGRNDFKIEAENNGGSDIESTTVILERQRLEPPSVRITRPSANPYRTSNDRVTIEARTERVAGSGDVEYKVNNETIRDFDFRNSRFQAEAYLREGRNIISVHVYNQDGEDQDQITIEYTRPQTPGPDVSFTTPNRQNSTVSNSRQNIRATVRNIDRKDQITMYLNGQRTTNFSFNNRSRSIEANVNLREGENEVAIEVRNNGGSDQASVFITYEKEIIIQPNRPPRVTINRPGNNSTTEEEEVDLRALVLHVNSKNDINLFVNGQRTTNFNFTLKNKELKAKVRLRTGSNRIVVEGRNGDGSDQDEVSITYRPESRPPNVNITRPSQSSSTTEQATAEVRATIKNVNNKRDISFTLNGRSNSNFSFSGGELRAKVNLQEGDNKITIKATNGDGSDQDVANINYKRKSTPPTVNITRPSQGSSTTEQSTADVRATIKNVDNKGDVSFTLNGKSNSNFSFSRGELRATINLKDGDNKVVIKATNNDGSDQDVVNINYKRKSTPPTVNITRPSQSSSTTEQASADVRATIKNVDDKRNVSFTLNGKSSNNFSFNKGELRATVKLKKGENKIVIKASNKDGSDQDQASITYKIKVSLPVVTFTSPSNNSTINSSKTSIKARIMNVTDKSKVTFQVNGKSIKGFTFTNTIFAGQAALKEGKNTIKIKGTNDAGSDEEQLIINYKLAEKKPTITFIKPSKPGGKVTLARTSVEVKLEHVKSKGDITFKVNGKSNKIFKFNAKTGMLTSMVGLKKGKNTFVVTGKNGAGTAKAESSVTYDSQVLVLQQKPKIDGFSNSSPVLDPFRPNEATITIEAKLVRVNSRDEITFTLNGKAVTNYEFNQRTGAFSGRLKLTRSGGDQKIVLKVSNKQGSDSKEKTIKF